MVIQKKVSKSTWGPSAWIYLHVVTLAAPENFSEESSTDYFQFFTLVGRTLPCAICRKHYEDYIYQYPPQFKNRQQIVRWLFDLHNDVNMRLNKNVLTYEQFIQLYVPVNMMSTYGVSPSITVNEKTNKENYSKRSTYFIIIIAVIILLAICFQIYINRD